jgi:hypothetical protein
MNQLDERLEPAWLALKLGYGLVPLLAGLDKFFNLLTFWPKYVSPTVATILPIGPQELMYAIGVIEIAVGLMILARWTALGSYVAAAWLVGIAINLVLAGYFDVAVRDVMMAVGAFTLARMTEVRGASEVRSHSVAIQHAVATP